jgi:hypothetical protein
MEGYEHVISTFQLQIILIPKSMQKASQCLWVCSESLADGTDGASAFQCVLGLF